MPLSWSPAPALPCLGLPLALGLLIRGVGGRPSAQGWGEGHTDTECLAQVRCSVPKGSCPCVLGHFGDNG